MGTKEGHDALTRFFTLFRNQVDNFFVPGINRSNDKVKVPQVQDRATYERLEAFRLSDEMDNMVSVLMTLYAIQLNKEKLNELKKQSSSSSSSSSCYSSPSSQIGKARSSSSSSSSYLSTPSSQSR
jgi:hypothetical protein